jgi:glycosyltransferase involved in cell wall biosynthesis
VAATDVAIYSGCFTGAKMIFLIVIGLLSLSIYLFLAVEALLGARQIGQLRDIEPLRNAECPSVSIIVPALNEAATIKPALASVLALDYPDLEVIAINDRSTDETGLILDQMAKSDSRLRVYHIKELPAGWLGKNHALWYGAARAKGDLLLFTDADVVMTEKSLRRAVGFMLAEQLDHLAIFFDTIVPGGLLNMMILDFACAFMTMMKPWKARQTNSHYHIGVGAFNLVRAETYHRCGTHQAIAMNPVDDVELGRLLKANGGRQDCLFGRNSISVKWYNSVSEMVCGLEKNIMPFCGYSLLRIIAVSAAIIILRIWPMSALFLVQDRILLALNGLLVIIQAGLAITAAANSSIPVRHVLWLPLAPFIGLYILWNSAIKTIFRGGIIWRNTFYSLDELQKKR